MDPALVLASLRKLREELSDELAKLEERRRELEETMGMAGEEGCVSPVPGLRGEEEEG
jgi:hypothetical protein